MYQATLIGTDYPISDVFHILHHTEIMRFRHLESKKGSLSQAGSLEPWQEVGKIFDSSDVRKPEILYEVLSQCLECYFKHLTGISATHTGIELLKFYVEKWDAFQLSAHGIRFWYLQLKDWVKEQQRTTMDIAQPYRLCFQYWRNKYFLLVKERLLEACEVMRQNGQAFDFSEREIKNGDDSDDEQLSQDFQDILPSNIYEF